MVFIIVLGQHVSVLIESSSGPSKKQILTRICFLEGVQWKIPDDVQRNCPKHVEFYSENKFEKLVHLVGFITRIFHNSDMFRFILIIFREVINTNKANTKHGSIIKYIDN